MTLVNLARHLHIGANAEAIQAALEPVSRCGMRGSLGQGQTITTPLLVINGTRDGIAPGF